MTAWKYKGQLWRYCYLYYTTPAVVKTETPIANFTNPSEKLTAEVSYNGKRFNAAINGKSIGTLTFKVVPTIDYLLTVDFRTGKDRL